MEQRQTLPNAVTVLVLGICSIVFGCLFIGLVLGVVGLAISGTPKRMYEQNPGQYEGIGMLTAGRVMSIIGIILGALYLIYYVICVLIIGAAGYTIWKMH
jgi:hypothetical protein